MAHIPPARVVEVSFGTLCTESIRNRSVVCVRYPDIYLNGTPRDNGVYSSQMGVSDHGIRCLTCGAPRETCPGHFGHVDLRYPVKNPFGVEDLIRWLKAVCWKCGQIIAPPRAYKNVARSARLKVTATAARYITTCPRCGAPHHHVEHNGEDPAGIVSVSGRETGTATRTSLDNISIRRIISRIPNSTVAEFGRTTSPPTSLILDAITAPPVPLRPNIRRLGGGSRASTNNELTTMLRNIVNANNALPTVIPEAAPGTPLFAECALLDRAVFEMFRGSPKSTRVYGAPLRSIAGHLPGKSGVIRHSLLGKRGWVFARAVITGDPNLRIDEIGIPHSIAMLVEISETVRPWNRARLETYLANARVTPPRYPAARHVEHPDGRQRKAGFVEHLNDGDIVYRDIITGDIMPFNRQPSLWSASINTHYAVVLEEPTSVSDRYVSNVAPMVVTFRINPCVCKFYGADFDGDEMNLFIPRGPISITEAMICLSIERQAISSQTGKPAIGVFQDPLVGIFMLSKAGREFGRYDAMQLLRDVSTSFLADIKFGPTPVVSSWELISQLLRRYPVNISRPAAFRVPSPDFQAIISYRADETQVDVRRGVLVRGRLDKKTVGQGAGGGIPHAVITRYGPTAGLDFVYNLSQLSLRYLLTHGFTLTMRDILMPRETAEEVMTVARTLLASAGRIVDLLDAGRLVPPIGMSVMDFFEMESIETLRVTTECNIPIVRAITETNGGDPHLNSMYTMVVSGSKGDFNKIISISGVIGQQTVHGRRLPELLEGRSMIWCPRYSTDPVYRGFIPENYTRGLSLCSVYTASVETRDSLVQKALSTSITGYQERLSTMAMGGNITDYIYRTVKGRSTVQLLYGDTGVEPRYADTFEFPVKADDAAFREQFSATPAWLDKTWPKHSGPKLHTAAGAEFERLWSDRGAYRDMRYACMRSAGATARLVKDVIPVPVNVRRVLDDILFEHGQKDTPAQFDPFETLQAVDAACSALPYAFTNPWREHERVAMPVYVQCATRIMALTIRATFSLRELARVGATNNVITAALRRIRSLYEEALIQPGMSVGILAAQNMIEPLTQYVLNAHHRSGAQGTSLNVITRFKELVGARAGPALVGTTMTFRLRDGVDDITAHSVAARVESLTFSQFVTAWQIFYEQFGRPEHPDYVGEREMIRAHQRYSARGVAVPSDLSRWCLRFELNRTVMVEKSLDLDTIVQQLHVLFPDTYIVYTPESVAHIVIRIYLRVGKRAASRDDVTKTLHIILDSVIRGTPGVVNARVDDEVSVSRIGANGAISDAKCNIVVTGGTNISAILEMCARGQEPLIDPASVRTSDMHEIMRVYGVEALRTAIITEFESLLPDVASPHYTVYADEMTYTGDYTGIERNPANRADVLLTAATGSPVQALEAASLNGARSVVAGVIPPIILGQAPALGTAFPQIVVNPDAEKVRGVDDLLAQL